MFEVGCQICIKARQDFSYLCGSYTALIIHFLMAWEIIVYAFAYCYCRQKRRKYHACTYTGGYPHSFQGSAPAFVKSYLWKAEVFSGFVIGSICTLEFSLFYQLSNSYFKQNPRPEVEDLRYLKLAVCRYTLQVKFWAQLQTVKVCVISLNGTRLLMGELLNKWLHV